jgi:hypothetical protein
MSSFMTSHFYSFCGPSVTFYFLWAKIQKGDKVKWRTGKPLNCVQQTATDLVNCSAVLLVFLQALNCPVLHISLEKINTLSVPIKISAQNNLLPCVIRLSLFCLILLTYIFTVEGRDCSVGTETSFGLDGWGSIPCRVKIFLFSTASRPTMGPTQPSIQVVPGQSGRGINLTIYLHLVPRSRMVEL